MGARLFKRLAAIAQVPLSSDSPHAFRGEESRNAFGGIELWALIAISYNFQNTVGKQNLTFSFVSFLLVFLI
jgi:hypothetical protein